MHRKHTYPVIDRPAESPAVDADTLSRENIDKGCRFYGVFEEALEGRKKKAPAPRYKIDTDLAANTWTTGTGHEEINRIERRRDRLAVFLKETRGNIDGMLETGLVINNEQPKHRLYKDAIQISTNHIPKVATIIEYTDFVDYLRQLELKDLEDFTHLTKRQRKALAAGIKSVITAVDGKVFGDTFKRKMAASAVSFEYVKNVRRAHIVYRLAIDWLMSMGIIKYADVEYQFNGKDNGCRQYEYTQQYIDLYNENTKAPAYGKVYVNTRPEINHDREGTVAPGFRSARQVDKEYVRRRNNINKRPSVDKDQQTVQHTQRTQNTQTTQKSAAGINISTPYYIDINVMLTRTTNRSVLKPKRRVYVSEDEYLRIIEREERRIRQEKRQNREKRRRNTRA